MAFLYESKSFPYDYASMEVLSWFKTELHFNVVENHTSLLLLQPNVIWILWDFIST